MYVHSLTLTQQSSLCLLFLLPPENVLGGRPSISTKRTLAACRKHETQAPLSTMFSTTTNTHTLVVLHFKLSCRRGVSWLDLVGWLRNKASAGLVPSSSGVGTLAVFLCLVTGTYDILIPPWFADICCPRWQKLQTLMHQDV